MNNEAAGWVFSVDFWGLIFRMVNFPAVLILLLVLGILCISAAYTADLAERKNWPDSLFFWGGFLLPGVLPAVVSKSINAAESALERQLESANISAQGDAPAALHSELIDDTGMVNLTSTAPMEIPVEVFNFDYFSNLEVDINSVRPGPFELELQNGDILECTELSKVLPDRGIFVLRRGGSLRIAYENIKNCKKMQNVNQD